MKIITSIFFFLLTQACGFAQQTNFANISKQDDEAGIINKAVHVVPSPRQLRWQQLELTAFFHFGVNTFTDREWGTGKEDPKIFNPSSFDARQWVRVIKEAGFKQVIITAKHHDGFCLWPSKFTNHSVKSSDWKNGNGDVVKEVSNACKEYGIGFGIYLSPWDRNSPLYGTNDYNNYFINQLSELLTNYGRIDEVWFDGANGEGPNGKKQVYDFGRWYQLIRRLQPKAVIAIMGPDVRWVGTETGYGRETEWSVVPVNNSDPFEIANSSQKDISFKPQGDMTGDDLGSRAKIRNAKKLVWYPAETDVSIRPGWFYHRNEDEKVKSPDELMDIYFNSVGRNSVLLMNIPPDKTGLINDADINNLKKWKQLRNKIFESDLAKGATIKKNTSSAIQLDLHTKKIFNVLMLQENIQEGQRIEKFILEYWNGSQWSKITEGTTVGYKRLIQFKNVCASKIRLRILSSRLKPNFSKIGLFLRSS